LSVTPRFESPAKARRHKGMRERLDGNGEGKRSGSERAELDLAKVSRGVEKEGVVACVVQGVGFEFRLRFVVVCFDGQRTAVYADLARFFDAEDMHPVSLCMGRVGPGMFSQ